MINEPKKEQYVSILDLQKKYSIFMTNSTQAMMITNSWFFFFFYIYNTFQLYFTLCSIYPDFKFMSDLCPHNKIHVLNLDFVMPQLHTLKKRGSAWPGNVSIEVILSSGSKSTRSLISFLQIWQIMASDWPSSGSYSASSWLISGSSVVDPEWTLAPMDPVRVKFDSGAFRVQCSVW